MHTFYRRLQNLSIRKGNFSSDSWKYKNQYYRSQKAELIFSKMNMLLMSITHTHNVNNDVSQSY